MAQSGVAAGKDCADTLFKKDLRCGAAVSGIVGSFASLVGHLSTTANLCGSPYPYFCAEVPLTGIAGDALTMSANFGDAVKTCPFTDVRGSKEPLLPSDFF